MTAQVSIKFKKGDLIRLKKRTVKAMLPDRMQNILIQQTEINIVNPIKAAASFVEGYSGGELRKSIFVKPLKASTNEVSVEVKSSKKYGIFVEKGTGIYGPKKRVIKPKGFKPMKFKNIKGGWISKWEIEGQKPQPFFYPTISKNRAKLRKGIMKEIFRK